MNFLSRQQEQCDHGQIDLKLSVSFYITSVPTVSACLAQLLRETSSLPEDLALHYLHQTLGALEHLHRRQIVHLDVKGLFLSQTICNIHMYMYYIDPFVHFMNFSNMGCKYCLERTKNVVNQTDFSLSVI